MIVDAPADLACEHHRPLGLAHAVTGETEIRWTRDGQRFVHSAVDATPFVRQLFRQYGEDIDDLEVRRNSLEDTYMKLVMESEGGAR